MIMKRENNHISVFGFIGQTMHSFSILLESKFEENNIELNLIQYIILNILNGKKGMILEDLSKLLNKDKSAILRHINYLEGEYFIAKMTDKHDRRRKILLPTKIGMDILFKARLVESNLNKDITSGLTEEDIDSFNKVLLAMNIQTMKLINK